MSEKQTFEAGEKLAVWASSTGHKTLVSVIEPEPARAQIEYGPSDRRRREWTAYDRLHRTSGERLSYDDFAQGNKQGK